MRKLILAAVFLALAVFVSAPAFAEVQWVMQKEWKAIIDEYEGNPFHVLKADSLYLVVILDKETPNVENPVAMDVRNGDGIPILFFIFKDKEANLIWANPMLLGETTVT